MTRGSGVWDERQYREHEITPDVVQAARENPNGWVYKIEGTYGSAEHVPPEAIVGAWKLMYTGRVRNSVC